MKRLTWALLFGIAFATTTAVVACGETDYTAGVYDKRYGQPGPGWKVPDYYDPTNDGGDAATGGNPAKLCDGKGPVDGGACTVSFKTTLMPLYIAGCGSATCHGVPNGAKPQMDPASPDITWANFAAQKPITNKPYINPCSTDKTSASIVCNMAAVGASCGTGMPLAAPGSLATQPIVTQTDTWLACGSPNN
jgi:hypothetical protein